MVKIHSAIYTRMAMNITHAHTRSSIVYNKVLRSEPHTHTLPHRQPMVVCSSVVMPTQKKMVPMS